ncbi:endonuclease/exonuclease/phosphatase family protein [Pedobacter ginsengisoli]|uniref:endonuclease/exonuclease/phosphatase family protein n=1 Tax=Pedobacter ginsengisoli TaxID=363852 RepID=UPI00254A4DC2|nr:endonuclease/exonuclease/phosphatase family protein [Pedobacter ginsengisoli]
MIKRLIYCLILAAFFNVGNVCAQQFTVASYNIRYDNKSDSITGNSWKSRCPVITKLIRYNDFEIFGAQEVLNHQLKDMLKEMPEYSYIGVGRDDGKEKGEYAPVFFKKERFKVLKSGQFWLSAITDRPNKGWDAVLPRICTWGRFQDLNSKLTFWFFNLHMDHVGVEARKNSATLALNKIKEMCKGEPVILTGDFNVDQTHENYQILNGSGIVKDAYETSNIRYAVNGTINNFNPNLKTDSRIDHIFVSNNLQVERYGILTDTYRSEVNESKIIKSGNFPKEISLHEYQARIPSDHFPVKVVVKYVRAVKR